MKVEDIRKRYGIEALDTHGIHHPNPHIGRDYGVFFINPGSSYDDMVTESGVVVYRGQRQTRYDYFRVRNMKVQQYTNLYKSGGPPYFVDLIEKIGDRNWESHGLHQVIHAEMHPKENLINFVLYKKSIPLF